MPRPKYNSSATPKRVTMNDIAQVAGVHVMTVSDALNGTGRVAPATRERIVQLARELNYVPNVAARALSTGRTGRIALLSGALNEAYYANIVHILKNHVGEAGYKLLLVHTPNEVKEIADATENNEIDGAIAIDMHSLVDQFRLHSSVPCVSIGVYQRSFVDTVIIDLSAATEKAIKLMLATGRKRIAYVVTTVHMAVPEEGRARAYLNTMESNGLAPEVINLNNDSIHEAPSRLTAYIKQNGCPEGLFCQNDEVAMCAYGVLRDLGYRVPDDALLVGCDGQLHMSYFNPPLSTIVQPLEEICDTAWRFLQQRMANPTLPRQHANIAGELRVTASLGSAL
ncbi:LacI family transcriptional regulator [bacterium]|nr:MAG: LacI family transcriptional regulator [bacterium]